MPSSLFADPALRRLFTEFCALEQPIMPVYEGMFLVERADAGVRELSRWLRSQDKRGRWYSGIEYVAGAQAANLGRCTKWGYDGCLFYLPSRRSANGDAAMAAYAQAVKDETG